MYWHWTPVRLANSTTISSDPWKANSAPSNRRLVKIYLLGRCNSNERTHPERLLYKRSNGYAQSLMMVAGASLISIGTDSLAIATVECGFRTPKCHS